MDGTSLAVLLKQTEALVRERLRPALDELGLTLEHWRIMAVLHDAPGASMGPLAGQAVVPAATLTRLTDKLVERGMVVRRIDPGDRRRTVVALSPMGVRLTARLRAEEDELARDLAVRLGGDRFTRLTRELEELVQLTS